MTDLQRDETLNRKSIILAAISSSQKETLDSSKADEWLFGEKLRDRLKAAKTIERSGKSLKVKQKLTKSQKLQGPASKSTFQILDVGRAQIHKSQSHPVQQEERDKSEQRSSEQLSIANIYHATEEIIEDVSNPAGRLRFFLPKWKELTCDPRVLEWIKGYKIPFASPVIQDSSLKEHSWSLIKRFLIKEHLKKLI